MLNRLTLWSVLFLVLLSASPAALPEEEAEQPIPDGMIYIPGGKFLMGVDVAEGEKPTNESPRHPVELSPFYIDRYEVTNRDFEKFIAAKGYEKKEFWSEDGLAWLAIFPEDKKRTHPNFWEERKASLGEEFPSHPVTGVSWYEAEAYASFAGKRLPTEAEWERAARGTDGRKYPWGNEAEPGIPEIDPDLPGPTRPVGSNPGDVSPEGLFDTGGSVSEWTSSWYDGYPGTKYSSRYFGEDARRRMKVARGGSWRSVAQGARTAAHECRTTYREYQYSRRLGHAQIGFRLAKDAE